MYRPEVAANRARRLYGDIILRGSLPSWIITALLAGSVIGAVLYGLLVQVDGQSIFSWMLDQTRS